jgi:glycerol-3-phosphate dehydrogenase
LPIRAGAEATALLIPKTKDGRVVFLIPFQGNWLLGTTDEEVSSAEVEPQLERQELEYLLETLNPYLDQPVPASDLLAGFGGYRPLITDTRVGTKGLLRDHTVEHDAVSGLFSLLGGKWTTYRIMARDAVDQIAGWLGREEVCQTADIPLFGAQKLDERSWDSWCEAQIIPEDVARHLYLNYGAGAWEVAKIMQQSKEFAKRILPSFPFTIAEIKYSVQLEKCCTLRDFLARRIRFEILDWEATLLAIPIVAPVMAMELGWSTSEQQQQMDSYTRLLKDFGRRTTV